MGICGFFPARAKVLESRFPGICLGGLYRSCCENVASVLYKGWCCIYKVISIAIYKQN